ncbi:unnamed protein product [Callosobruchus maculatus]|uniref:Uncharacterized protein n=1 Tax=Callosobruchus maculatus TaxID=64391 RepID=A0A653BJY5_CALMS|nr:unnamed protein product [Callosobruchus maculatus]
MDHTAFLEKLKANFDITTNLRDVLFKECSIKKYSDINENVFGEKLFLLYTCDISIYNVSFLIKILSFNYVKKNEILKLDIEVPDKQVEKEVARTRNYLKRYRNLNETLRLLIQTSKFLETRRLVTEILFSKEPWISLSRLDDGALCIQYLEETDDLSIKIIVGWRIDRDLKSNAVIDVIEVYYNNFNLPNAPVIKDILTSLTHPSLDFHEKLKLWKSLIVNLQDKRTRRMPSSSLQITSDTDNVILISDSTVTNDAQARSTQVDSVINSALQSTSDTDNVILISDSAVTKNKHENSTEVDSVIYISDSVIQTEFNSSEADGVIVISDCIEENQPSVRKRRRVGGVQTDSSSTSIVIID